MNGGIRGGRLYIGQDNVVFAGNRFEKDSGVYDTVTETFINDATVTFTLKDSAGSAVSGASSISMSYVTGTRGVYEGVLEDGVSLTAGSTYYLEITATGSSDRVGFRRIAYEAEYRGAD
jgi:hypothetical protein